MARPVANGPALSLIRPDAILVVNGVQATDQAARPPGVQQLTALQYQSLTPQQQQQQQHYQQQIPQIERMRHPPSPQSEAHLLEELDACQRKCDMLEGRNAQLLQERDAARRQAQHARAALQQALAQQAASTWQGHTAEGTVRHTDIGRMACHQQSCRAL